ncbi:MAG: ATP-binding protein, partial [Ramlibacter sp.]
MSDLTSPPNSALQPKEAEQQAAFRAGIRKAAARLQDWFTIQSVAVKTVVVAVAILIPVTAVYSWSVLQRQEQVAEQVLAMAAADKASDGVWTYNKKLPVVFGPGSVLSFLQANASAVDHITVVYTPLSWNVSERYILIESRGRQYAYYPSDIETKIFADKAVNALWGGKLTFVPKAELDNDSAEVFARLEQRFSGARPQSEKDAWKAGVSALISAAMTLGLLAFLWFQLRGQFKALKFVEPSQVHGDIRELVGMDDIKSEVAQIKDQYLRRKEYAEYGVNKPFNVMFSGPAGTGKTKLASYLAKELGLPVLFHSAANLETGYVGGGSQTLGRILAMAKRR